MDETKLRAWLHEISGVSGLLSCLSEAPDEDLTLERVRRLTKTSADLDQDRGSGRDPDLRRTDPSPVGS